MVEGHTADAAAADAAAADAAAAEAPHLISRGPREDDGWMIRIRGEGGTATPIRICEIIEFFYFCYFLGDFCSSQFWTKFLKFLEGFCCLDLYEQYCFNRNPNLSRISSDLSFPKYEFLIGRLVFRFNS